MAQVVYGYRATVEAGEGGHEKDCEEAVNYPAAQGRENTGATPTSLRGTSGGGVDQAALLRSYKRDAEHYRELERLFTRPESISAAREQAEWFELAAQELEQQP